MSKAEQMFKDLGWKKEIDNSIIPRIIYKKPDNIYDCDDTLFITFYLNEKEYATFTAFCFNVYITKDLHLAITEQMKELGWL